jgi:hypothetical protein
MRRLMRTSLLTPILPALLFVAAGNAFGQINTSISYRITAKHSGKCLAVAGGVRSLNNGDGVIQWDCLEAENNQKWKIDPVGGDYYKITAQHSGKSLSVFGGIASQGNGAVVQQWDYNGGANQMWRFICLGDGSYQIVAKHSGKTLDINGGPDATGNGPYAQQWENRGGDNQKFRLQPLSPGLASGRATPATCPSEADARIRFNLSGADNRFDRRTRPFRVDQTIALNFENNTGAPIYLNQGRTPELLFREDGLQVERRDGSNWFPVLPSGRCPDYVVRDNGDGTATGAYIDDVPVTRLIDLRATMNITRLWIAPAALGPGNYRLSLAYYRSRDTQSAASFVCSPTFEVAR